MLGHSSPSTIEILPSNRQSDINLSFLTNLQTPPPHAVLTTDGNQMDEILQILTLLKEENEVLIQRIENQETTNNEVVQQQQGLRSARRDTEQTEVGEAIIASISSKTKVLVEQNGLIL